MKITIEISLTGFKEVNPFVDRLVRTTMNDARKQIQAINYAIGNGRLSYRIELKSEDGQ